MKTVRAEVAVYALSRDATRELVRRSMEVFESRNVEYHPGSMSTVLCGEADAVFEAIRDVFSVCSDDCKIVLRCVVSNYVPE